MLLLRARIALATGRLDVALPLLERSLAVAPRHPFVLDQLNRLSPKQRLAVGGFVLSRGTAALPAEAFAAQLRLQTPLIPSGANLALVVEVENRGNAVWTALGSPDGAHRFTFGHRWLDAQGGALQEGRVLLSHDVDPGERIVFDTLVPAPPPGSHRLEVAMVEGENKWWSDVDAWHLLIEIQGE